MQGKKLDPKKLKKARALYLAGMSVGQVATEIGISYGSAYNACEGVRRSKRLAAKMKWSPVYTRNKCLAISLRQKHPTMGSNEIVRRLEDPKPVQPTVCRWLKEAGLANPRPHWLDKIATVSNVCHNNNVGKVS